jgi:hypothetical protein
MAFSIRFLSESFQAIEHHPITEAVGEIVLGEFRELFISSLSFWTKAQYEDQWITGLNRLVQNVSPSALITTMYDPTVANFIFWWPMYRQDDKVLVHNQMLLLMHHRELLNPDNPYTFIYEYESVDEEGQKVSEWEISIEDISTFLRQAGWSL